MPHRLSAYLNSSKELSPLSNKARQLMALQQQVELVVPAPLRSACRVMQFEQRKLTLLAENGATAAKLRQMTTSMAEKLRKMGGDVTVIQVLVQANNPPHKAPEEVRSVGLEGEKQIAALAAKLADSPLKDALSRLAKKSDRS